MQFAVFLPLLVLAEQKQRALPVGAGRENSKLKPCDREQLLGQPAVQAAGGSGRAEQSKLLLPGQAAVLLALTPWSASVP